MVKIRKISLLRLGMSIECCFHQTLIVLLINYELLCAIHILVMKTNVIFIEKLHIY